MQIKSHGVTGSGIRVRKSAGKTDRIETPDGYGRIHVGVGKGRQFRADQTRQEIRLPISRMKCWPSSQIGPIKGLNGDRHKKMMPHQLCVFNRLALSGCCGGCTGCSGGD
jgi:hypothetical protein